MPDFSMKYCIDNLDHIDTFCIYQLGSITPSFKFRFGKPPRRDELILKVVFSVELAWWTDLNIPRVANQLFQLNVEKFDFGIVYNGMLWYEYVKLCINLGWFVTPLHLIAAS